MLPAIPLLDKYIVFVSGTVPYPLYITWRFCSKGFLIFETVTVFYPNPSPKSQVPSPHSRLYLHTAAVQVVCKSQCLEFLIFCIFGKTPQMSRLSSASSDNEDTILNIKSLRNERSLSIFLSKDQNFIEATTRK